MTRRGHAVLIAFSIALVSFARAAVADPARLVYTRGPGAERCPDDAALRRAVTARLGHEAFVASADLTMNVEVTSDGGRLRGRIRVDAGGVQKGSQTIDGGPVRVGAPSCDDLFASIALAVSVALDAAAGPEGPAEARAPTPAPAPTPALAPAPAPAPARAPAPAPAPALAPAPARARAPAAAPAPRPHPPLSLWIATGGRLSIGAWPVVAFAPDLLAELRYGPVGLALEGRFELPVSVDSGQASVERVTGSALPCVHFGWFVPCGIVALGETTASGAASVLVPKTKTALYAAFGARLGVDVRLASRFHLLGTLDVVGIATPIKVGVVSTVANSGPVEGSAGIALLVSIF